MQKTSVLALISVLLIVMAAFAGREWGIRESSSESLLLAARTNLAMQLKVAEVLRRGDSNDAESRLDASINSLIIELNQLLPSSSAEERMQTEALFGRVAEYRKEFPDSSASRDGNPSSPSVKAILARYTK